MQLLLQFNSPHVNMETQALQLSSVHRKMNLGYKWQTKSTATFEFTTHWPM